MTPRPHGRLRRWEDALHQRLQVTGAHSTARVGVPLAWVLCITSIVVVVLKDGVNPTTLPNLAACVGAMVVTGLLLVVGNHAASYLYAGILLVAPWTTFAAQLHQTRDSSNAIRLVFLLLFPLVASGLWTSRRNRPIVLGITLMSVLSVAAAVATGDVSVYDGALVATGVAAVGAYVTWSANQQDRKDIDPLTGLPNQTRLRTELELGLRPGELAGREDAAMPQLLLVDVDGLGPLTRRVGTAQADALLAAAGDNLRATLAPSAAVYYVGAGTFAAVAPGGGQAPQLLASAAFAALADLPEDVSACVGLAEATRGESARRLMSRAENSLQRAKACGPGSQDPRMDEHWVLRDLPSAIENGQLTVAHQPIVELTTGAVVGSEALVRWLHPQRGQVPPEVFVGLAEDSGLIADLDQFVLRTACTVAAAAHRNGPTPQRLNVNVSPQELHASDYPRTVLDTLEAAGLDPGRLVLEVTESSVSDVGPDLLRTLTTLRDHGVRIAIDDFGTGYSSLSRLARLPIDILKIDKSFVWTHPDDGRDHLLAAIVALAEAFGIHTVAEGIETWDQVELLRDLGCTYGQGFLFGRPGAYADLLPPRTAAAPGPQRLSPLPAQP